MPIAAKPLDENEMILINDIWLFEILALKSYLHKWLSDSPSFLSGLSEQALNKMLACFSNLAGVKQSWILIA